MKITQILQDKAKLADKPAIIFKDKIISFLQLKDFSFRLANSLIKIGINKQDKVGIYLPNSPEYVYSYLALWSIGATCVPLDFMLTEEELVSFLNHSEARLLIAKTKAGISFLELKERCPYLKGIILTEEGNNFLSFKELLETGLNKIPKINIDDKDYAIIFYTSGTTGRPKGVLVNYLQLSAPPKAMEFFVDLTEKDIALCAVPFSHLGGLVYIQNLISFGLSVVLMERFLPLEFLRNIEKYKVTCFWIVPSMYYAMLELKEFEELDLSSLRWIVTFGASSCPDALRRFHKYCPQAHILNGWGLTETNAPTTVIKMGSNKLESVGRPAPWIEVKVFDENAKELSFGQVGEIVVKGWVVTDGYYKEPLLTKEVIKDGWFYTGDMGRFDEEGDLYIVGRKKEMIKVAGEIVFEPEVESIIMKHPEVIDCAVIGVFDKLRGEVPKAFVVLKEGAKLKAEDLRDFCRKHLAHFKIPHYFAFLKELPKTRSGKIDKESLRIKP
ncbi:MAG: AMP-binding protein [Candidatus Omnitrophica bacterium]|nr:AMP-binding protein [Candidatus Omnitrophota bacterium]